MLRRSLGASVDVEDLTQEVFLVVFQKVRSLRDPTSLKAFVIGVTARRSLEHRRRLSNRRSTLMPRGSPCDPDLVARQAEARIALSRLLEVLAHLRPSDRAAAMLRLVAFRELKEIAMTIDVSLATVKRRIARGSAKVARLAERDPFLAPYRHRLDSRS